MVQEEGFLNLMSWHFVPKILEAILMDIRLALNPPFIDYYELCNILLLRYVTTAPYVIIYYPHNYFFPSNTNTSQSILSHLLAFVILKKSNSSSGESPLIND